MASGFPKSSSTGRTLLVGAATVCLTSIWADLIAGVFRDARQRRLVGSSTPKRGSDSGDLPMVEASGLRAIAAADVSELEFIARELSRAFGIAVLERTAGAETERAGTNTQRRLRSALSRIEAVEPDLGRHLQRSVTTS